MTSTLVENVELETISRTKTHSLSDERNISELEADQALTLTISESGSQPHIDKRMQWTSALQFGAVCWVKMLCGWNDGTSGPLIPRLQEVYHVNFIVVSLIFVMACVGFITGAIINVPLTDRFGFGKVILGASICQVIVYSVQSAGVPFPLYIMMFVLNGIGLSLQDAQAVTYVASLKSRPELKMMVLQAAYGFGAFSAPLVSTQFATMDRWSFHYLVSLALSLINTLMLGLVFRGRDLDACLARVGLPATERGTSEHSKMRQILSLKTVHLLGIFCLFYVGAEVTIGGWIVTFIQQVREGGPSSGYISSGFFGGLMLGRLALIWVSQKLGDRAAMFIYTALAIGLELIVWFVPSLIGGAVAVSFVGFVLGPMYPILMSYAARVLPRWLLSGSVGWIASLGQAGSAMLPFITGAVANNSGIKTLQPMVVGMLVIMGGLWACVPRSPRRND